MALGRRLCYFLGQQRLLLLPIWPLTVLCEYSQDTATTLLQSKQCRCEQEVRCFLSLILGDAVRSLWHVLFIRSESLKLATLLERRIQITFSFAILLGSNTAQHMLNECATTEPYHRSFRSPFEKKSNHDCIDKLYTIAKSQDVLAKSSYRLRYWCEMAISKSRKKHSVVVTAIIQEPGDLVHLSL